MPSQQDVINTILAEAGNSQQGMAAVAHVIANRAAARGLTPAQVVAQPHQFEAYSNPSPGGVANQQNATLRAQAEAIWQGVQNGTVPDPTAGGTNYFANYIAPPDWARGAVSTGQTTNIGGQTFLLGSGTVPPANIPSAGIPATDSYATATAPPLPRATPSDATQQAVTNPDGSVNWGAFYQGLAAPTPLASGPASGNPIFDDFAALGMQQPTTGSAALAAQLAAHPPSATQVSDSAPVLGTRNASGSPDDRDASGSLLAQMLATVQGTGAGPTKRQVQTVPVDPNTGQPLVSAGPGYNSTTEAQRNALLALGGSMDSAPPNNGYFRTGQGIAGTAQLPADYHPAAGLIPSLDSVPTPSSSGSGSGQQNAQSWANLISSFDNDSTGPYAAGTINNAKDQSQLPQGTGLGYTPSTTQQITVKQLNPAYTSWLNNQNSAIYGVEGVDSPSLDANGNVVLPSSYLGAAPAAPVKYLSVPKTITVPGKAISAPSLLGIAAAPTPAAPIASTNGYTYAPNGSGGYTQVGQVNPNLTPSQQYNQAAAKALASQPDPYMNNTHSSSSNSSSGGGTYVSLTHSSF